MLIVSGLSVLFITLLPLPCKLFGDENMAEDLAPSVLPIFGRSDTIHSMFSAVARSVQSGVVCPLISHGYTSSQTNIVSWSVLSEDSDLITAFIISLG